MIINRRQLLTAGLKAGAGMVLFDQLSGLRPIFAAATIHQAQPERYAAAYQLLDQFIARHMIEVGAPGMTLALANRDGLLRSSQYGFADLKTGRKVQPATLFEIGSISKSFVAIALLQLVDEGKLDLNKPVKDYLPWLRVESSYAPFTTHHLLSHTAGLSAVPLLLRVAATTLRVGSEPGTRWVYSNIGYVLLGFLLETLDKRPFAESMRRRVLDPLGMNQSVAVISAANRDRFAVGYGPLKLDRPFPPHGPLAEAPWLDVGEAAGSIASTANDMSSYLSFLLNHGVGPKGRVLSDKGYDLLTKPVIKSDFRGEGASYAYGLWVSEKDGHTLLRHTGGMVAFTSAMYADTTSGFAAFASVNASLFGSYRPVAVTRYAIELLNAAGAGKDLPSPPPPPPPSDRVSTAADYAGTFTTTDGGKLILVSRGEQLLLQHEEVTIALEPAARDLFFVNHPDWDTYLLGFTRRENQVTEAFHGSRWWINAHYAGPKTFTYPAEWDAYAGHYHSDSPWYGSTRVVIRNGQLLVEGLQPLEQIASGVFRVAGQPVDVDRVVFDKVINGRAMRANYSGIEFFRSLTP
ncbi:MAG TPA: serine hydrolase domain-containing protein [Pyrinomonadaceae bacterium]|nr:serine hydrolase domain-containing protein [Pyrinomonadaceae bacterium]